MRLARCLDSVWLSFSRPLLCGRRTWKIVIPAGTPEDKELTAIAAEPDAQKRIAMYEVRQEI